MWQPGGFISSPSEIDPDPECLEHGYQFGDGQCAALVQGTMIAAGPPAISDDFKDLGYVTEDPIVVSKVGVTVPVSYEALQERINWSWPNILDRQPPTEWEAQREAERMAHAARLARIRETVEPGSDLEFLLECYDNDY